MDICNIVPPRRLTSRIPFRLGHRLNNVDLPAPRSLFRCCLHQHSNSMPKSEESLEGHGGNRMFILGMGFVGQFLAADLKRKGWVVRGTCTSVSKKKKLQEMGLDALVFDATKPELQVLNIIKYHTHLLISVPPVADVGDPMLQHKELLHTELKDGNLEWLGYLSTTSVYGDCGGAWVDENYPIRPLNELAGARSAAEEGWLKLGQELNISTQIFRLGGIYGPGRSAVDTILKQGPLSESQKMRSSKSYTSRIHVADICQVLNASIQKPSAGKIYNVVDDDPASREEVFAFAERLIEEKWPSRVEHHKIGRTESRKPRKHIGGEKRVSNARMKTELGVKLLYPTYQSGLEGIIELIDSQSQNLPG